MVQEGRARTVHEEIEKEVDIHEKENFIQLKKDNIIRIGIIDSNGKDTGEHLEFDLDDIELPLKLSKCEYNHRKNMEYLKMQLLLIDKKEDKKGKFILSKNTEEKIKVMKEFCDREEKALDLFLGHGGTKKILNGRDPYYGMYNDIDEILKPIYPILSKRMNNINDLIEKKYKNVKLEDVTLE